MKINKNDLSSDSRNDFNKYYDEAVNDILFLKDCNISINQIHDITNYQIDFIVFILQMYQLNKNDKMNILNQLKLQLIIFMLMKLKKWGIMMH